jgi:molecular chaperone GrpE
MICATGAQDVAFYRLYIKGLALNTEANSTVAAADEPSSDPAIAALESALQAAQAEAQANRDAQLRALAELENVRKRAQRDIENAHRFALERFAAELLPVRDSLELALQSGSADAPGLLAGVEATLKLLGKAFEKAAIVRIEPAGASFDPALQEAVLAQPSAQVPEGTVLQVLQSGYQLNGRLLRPARVIVSRAPDAGAGT